MFELTENARAFGDFAKELEKAPKSIFERTAKALVLVSSNFILSHRKQRLSGRPGLNVGSRIGLNRNATTEVIGNDLDSLVVGTFFNASVSRYVQVQELGTVGRGGQLPDIVPVRAKFLRFVVDGQVVFAKKVSIPPRLQWFQTWEKFAPERDRMLDRMLTDIVEGLA